MVGESRRERPAAANCAHMAAGGASRPPRPSLRFARPRGTNLISRQRQSPFLFAVKIFESKIKKCFFTWKSPPVTLSSRGCSFTVLRHGQNLTEKKITKKKKKRENTKEGRKKHCGIIVSRSPAQLCLLFLGRCLDDFLYQNPFVTTVEHWHAIFRRLYQRAPTHDTDTRVSPELTTKSRDHEIRS